MRKLKEQVATSAEWTLGEKVLTALVQFVVRVLIIRLLMPEDLKVVAILMALVSFALVVVDSGFSQMLLRKKEPTETDLKSVFLFNITSSLLLYTLLVALSPFLADYYAMPILREVAPLFFCMLPLNALGVIQHTMLSRRFHFARISKVIFVAQLISGLAAVVLAYLGWGVWALIWQQVVLMAVRSALLWWWGGWTPTGRGSVQALRQMAPYSMSLMATDLVTALYNKVPQLALGKIYLDATLGYYDQAIKLKDLPVQSAMQSVQQVTFPALAKIAHEQPKFSESFRQVLMVVAYAMFPVMVGMAAVAYDMFYLLIGEQWLPTVPLFEVVCLMGLFTPLAMMAYNVLKVKAEGGLILRLELLKKGFMTLALVVSIPRSVEAVVWALVASAAFDWLVNMQVALRLSQLGWSRA
ncbi:MAG: lipopolysaccharide biosynthesis protein, partial [Alistipes sp.]|nr:lipopolysaccharide biosynthesis protein [Alistipes sp.]